MLSVETRGHVVEITHGNRWRRPFYLELEGVELLETELDDRGRYTALLEVSNDKIDDVECADGVYRVDADAALGKQARVIDVLDGVMLVEYEGDLAYLMTAEAEAPTWQMVWRSGWYFVRQREVGSFAGKKRSRARKSRSRRNTRNRRNRNRRNRR